MTPEICCRVCFQHSSDLVDMKITFYKENLSLSKIFTSCTAIQNDEEEFLCRDCEIRLLNAYEFRVQAEESERIWKQMRFSRVKRESPEIFINEEFLDDELEIKIDENEKDLTMKSEIVDVKTLRCRFCLKFINHERLKDHEKDHIRRNDNFRCNFCSKKYKNRRQILEHLKSVHFSEKSVSRKIRYSREICKKSFPEKNSLRNHKRNVHYDNSRPKIKEICPLCGKEAPHLRKHIDMVHKNLITCYCDMCGKGFKTKGALINHLRYLHLGIREVQCPHCLKFYRNQAELETHISKKSIFFIKSHY